MAGNWRGLPVPGCSDEPTTALEMWSPARDCAFTTRWKILVDEGAMVEAGRPVAMIESMKMEMENATPMAGRIAGRCHQLGRTVRAGDMVALIEGTP